jgi:hypothetical protein
MRHILKFLSFIALFTLSTSFVFAVDPTPPPSASANMRWFCLSKVSADPGSHTAVLKVKDGVSYQSDKEVNVVVRIAFDHDESNLTAENSGMTTANPTLDQKILGGTAGLDALQSKLGFTSAGIVGGKNPTSVFPITWTDDLSKTSGGSQDRAHYWYGVQEAVPVQNTANGGEGGFQQGTFDFAQANGANDCEVIRWDPFGYVFDAQTHGPIEGVYVRILSSKTENGVYTPMPVGIGAGKVPQNPIATQKDGSYRYYVDPGFYKLELLGDVGKSSRKYVIEKDLSKIKPGYEEFGYEQIYLAEKPEVIREVVGKVERRDIAIETIGAPAPFSVDGPKLKDIIVNRSMQNGEQKVRLSGMVAQIPVDLIAVYKDNNNVKVSEERFSLVHGHKYVPQGLHDERNFDILVSAESKDGQGIFKELQITTKYSSKVLSVPISPMPSFLDGIARSKTGVPIVEGTVGIYAIGSDRPSYVTATNDVGHFSVNTEWIPPFPYELRYKNTTGDETIVSTSDYLKQNAVYHGENHIDSYVVKITEQDPAKIKQNTNKNVNNTPNGRVQPTETTQSVLAIATRTQGFFAIIIALVVLLLVGAGIFVIMRSKEGQAPPQL